MQIDRAKAAEHLRRGFPVLQDGKLLTPKRLPNGAHQLPAGFTANPDADAGAERPTVFTAMRHDDGAHTRAGLAYVIESGGGVMLGNSPEIITRLEDLPPEDVIAAGDVQRLEAAKKAQDEAHQRMLAEMEATNAALTKARQQAAEAAKNPAPTQAAPAQPNPLAGAPRMGGNPTAPAEQPVKVSKSK